MIGKYAPINQNHRLLKKLRKDIKKCKTLEMARIYKISYKNNRNEEIWYYNKTKIFRNVKRIYPRFKIQ